MDRENRDEMGALPESASPQAALSAPERRPPAAEHGDAQQIAHLTERQRRARGMAEASKFLGRLSQLQVADLREPIERWRRAVTTSSTGWFAAESALARLMTATGRHEEQERLLTQLVETLRYAGWFRRTSAVEKIGGSEASIQYTATLALLALLLRDQLDGPEFALLYGPFGSIIPLAELGPE